MQFTNFMDKYPVFSFELAKNATSFTSTDEIINQLEAKVKADPTAAFIGKFDHYAHTKALPEGEVASDILAAQHLIFCFGIKLPNPLAMAARPRSIGVVEQADKFVISFMEAPNPKMTEKIKTWVKGLAS